MLGHGRVGHGMRHGGVEGGRVVDVRGRLPIVGAVGGLLE